MAQFLKINPMSDNVNGTSLVNLSDATIIQCNSDQTGAILYKEIYSTGDGGVIALDGIDPGQPGPSTLLDAFHQAIESNPSARIIPFPVNISSVEYLGN